MKVARNITINMIAHFIVISTELINTLLKDGLNLSKPSSWWIQRFLNKFDADSEAFLNRIVTVDNTWINHFDPSVNNNSHMGYKKIQMFPINKKKRDCECNDPNFLGF